jgi:competence protein ComEC
MPEPAARLDLRLVPGALTAWAVTAAGVVWDLGRLLAAVGAAGAVAWMLACRLAGGSHRWLRTAAGGVLSTAVIGAGFGAAVTLRTDAVAHHPLAGLVGRTAWVSLTPGESPRQSGPGRLMFRAQLHRVADSEMSAAVTVFAPAADFGPLGAGQPVDFRARIGDPARRDLTVATLTAVGRPRFGQASTLQRAAGSVRERFASAAREALPADQAAVLPGLVLGDTAAVPAATTAEFRIAGLTHLTAVSGANVTIVCGAVLLSGYLIGPRAAVALAALALIALVVVVQPSASVLRAAVMGAIGLLAVLAARRRQAIPALAATVMALMVMAPQLSVDIGFALSVSATAALVLVVPVWSARLVGAGWPKPLAHALCVAVAAHLVTAPLVAAISGRFSVVAVLANLAVALVIPPITVLGTAAATVVVLWPGAADLLIRFTGPELWWLLRVAHVAAQVPGAAVPVPTGWAGVVTVGCAGGAGVLLWRRRWFRLASAYTLATALMSGAAWSVSSLVGGP